MRCLIILILFHFTSFSQIIPETGKKLPDFKLDNIKYYSKNEISNEDIKGKWLILDFWSAGCSTCIKSFPKINNLQKIFRDEIQFVLIGKNDKKFNSNIEVVYEKLQKKNDYNLVVAFDSLLVQKWQITAVPFMIIVNPKGEVEHITDGRDLNQEKISKLLQGESVSFYKNEIQRVKNDSEEIILSSSKNEVYHSILTKWNGEEQNGGCEISRFVSFSKENQEKGFNFSMVHLIWLYNTAYFGQYYLKFPSDPLYAEVYPTPVLEIKNDSLFQYSYSNELGKGLYNYSLKLPSKLISEENIKKAMQHDLNMVFQFAVTVEERDMPVYELVVYDKQKTKQLRSQSTEKYNSASNESIAAGIKVRNMSMEEFLPFLCYYLNEIFEPPFINSTRIGYNIDLGIEADLTNLEDVRKALRKNGLDLILGTKKMKVLVIKDPEPTE